MASSALIDDLLKQFAENPRRVFARLANEYRKNGELDTAIEICRAHVPLQPTYISGYIVLGQALYESGQLDEARGTFETALGLDPENLIALRQLGDIARDHGDLTGARAWYRRLLEVDPQNEEIAAQLRDLDAPAASAAPVPDVAAPQPPEVSWSDIHPEHESAPAASVEPAPNGPPEPAAVASSEPSHPADPQRLDFDFDVLSAFSTDVPASAAPEPEPEPAAVTPAAPAVPEAAAAPPLPPAPPELGDVAAFAPPRHDDAAAVEEEPALEPEPIAAAAPAAASEPVAETPAAQAEDSDEPLPAAFITETMAELYLQQGHREQALDIYRLLVAQRPGDLSLLNRIARLESTAPAAPAERTVRAFFSRFSLRHPPGAEPAPSSEPAAETAPEPVGQAVPAEPTPFREPAPFAEPEPFAEPTAAAESATVAEPEAMFEAPPAAASEPTAPEFSAAESGPTEAAPSEPAASTPDITAFAAPAPLADEPSITEFVSAEPEPPAAAAAAGDVEASGETSVPESAGGTPNLTELFAGRVVSADDERVAATLAGAYAAGADTNGVGHPARAADDALSLDDVFGGGPADHDAGREAVTFDEFFAQPNGARPAPPPADATAAPAGPGAPAANRSDDADLELFHAWLEGLKK